jgi:hypothetical protein
VAGQPSQQAIFEALLARYNRTIAEAFIQAINDLRAGADLGRLAQAISEGNIQAAIDALHLDPAALQPLRDAIGAAYRDGGTAAVNGLPVLRDVSGARFVIRFAVGNPRAENWLRDHSSTLITRIMEDQRVAVRQALTAGMQAGVNPRTTALDIIGRIERATGRRTGGILGLTSQQEQFVRSARAELESGDPTLLRHFLTRTRRDARFDKTVLKAIEDEKPVQADTVDKLVGRYADRLLQLRGEAIARTESLTSLHAGQDEAFRQAVEKGAVKENQVRRTWRSAHDTRVRHSHAILDGETVGLNGVFTSPSGAKMRFPGDTSLGAGPEEIVNCRCVLSNRIDFLSNLL